MYHVTGAGQRDHVTGAGHRDHMTGAGHRDHVTGAGHHDHMTGALYSALFFQGLLPSTSSFPLSFPTFLFIVGMSDSGVLYVYNSVLQLFRFSACH